MLSFALSIEVLLENALSTARECRAFLRDAPHWLWSELWSSDAVEWATMLDLWRVRCAASNAVLSVMVRVLGGPGDPATHLENRVGEPAANPYLYMASQIVCGLDGLDRKLDPGPSADTPYEAKAPMLPGSLAEALAALDNDKVLRAGLGDFFIDYYVKLKQAEIERFSSGGDDWEQREYFSIF